MTATAPTPRDLLVQARTLIARPEAWTQGAAARDADGEPVGVEHEDAVSWCATGALNCAMYHHVDSLEVPPPLQRARECAGTILTDTVRALNPERRLVFIFEDLHGILNSNARAQTLRASA